MYQDILEKLERIEKKLNILWERAQETDRLNSYPHGHADDCICKECYKEE